jgi:prepilin-type N-terminal cleavage/methylation domain-containing protein
MKSRKAIIFSHKGFTLIEIIATIMVAGILSALFIQFMGTALMRSGDAVNIVHDEASIEGLMEEIISDYLEQINKDTPASALNTIKTKNYGADVTMEYIQFDGDGNEQPSGSSNYLKVIIHAKGHTLTAVLTKSREKADDPIVRY